MASVAGRTLRKLMSTKCVALPGAFNGLVGRLVAESGFEGVYVSGGALSASKGIPDIGLLSLESFVNCIREVVSTSGLPCIADADTGFGETEMVVRTVFEYNAAGAAGLHLEDQVFPKRCGHLLGKSLISSDEMCAKVRKAANARDKFSNGEFIICARTDMRSVEGIEAAISRATDYVNSGADMIFPEGLETEEEFCSFAKAMKSLRGDAPGGGPFLLANMTEFGRTPFIPLTKFESAGYHAVIFPVTSLRVAMKAVQETLECLKEKGTVEECVGKMFSRNELYRTLKYSPGTEWNYPSSSFAANSQTERQNGC